MYHEKINIHSIEIVTIFVNETRKTSIFTAKNWEKWINFVGSAFN